MSRYLLSVGLQVRPIDTTFATIDAAIVHARSVFASCRQKVYLLDGAEPDQIRKIRGWMTADGWRWLKPCGRCTNGTAKAGGTCNRCDGRAFVEVFT